VWRSRNGITGRTNNVWAKEGLTKKAIRTVTRTVTQWESRVARYLSTKKEGDGRAQGLYDKIHPDSIMADVDRYLKQEEDS